MKSETLLLLEQIVSVHEKINPSIRNWNVFVFNVQRNITKFKRTIERINNLRKAQFDLQQYDEKNIEDYLYQIGNVGHAFMDEYSLNTIKDALDRINLYFGVKGNISQFPDVIRSYQNILDYVERYGGDDREIVEGTFQKFLDYGWEPQQLPSELKEFLVLYRNLIYVELPKECKHRINMLQQYYDKWRARVDANEKGGHASYQAEEVEELYHVTIKANRLLKYGFSKNFNYGEKEEGLGAFGRIRKTSFTYDYNIARMIYNYYITLWDIVHKNITLNQLIRWIQSMDIKNEISNEDIKLKIDEFRTRLKKKSENAAGGLRSYKGNLNDPYVLFRLFDWASSILPYGNNPLCCNRTRGFINQFKNLKKDDIGILKAKVLLKDQDGMEPVEWNNSEEEIRVTPDRIIGKPVRLK